MRKCSGMSSTRRLVTPPRPRNRRDWARRSVRIGLSASIHVISVETRHLTAGEIALVFEKCSQILVSFHWVWQRKYSTRRQILQTKLHCVLHFCTSPTTEGTNIRLFAMSHLKFSFLRKLEIYANFFSKMRAISLAGIMIDSRLRR